MAQVVAGDQLRILSVLDEGCVNGPWPEGSPVLLRGYRIPGLIWLPGLCVCLNEAAPELVHTHGLWTYLSIALPRWAQARARPYVVSPHGMLDAWALANSRWKKRLATVAFERRHLHGAACLHALSAAEAESIRMFGLRNPICVIPNGVEVPEENAEMLKTEMLKSERKILLFLGRLHPKKGLVNALKAWKQAFHSTSNIQNSKSHEWQFVVAGWDQGGHEAELKRLCDELELSYSDIPASDYVGGTPTLLESSSVKSVVQNSSSIVFLGPAFGETKDLLLRQASAFILPSFSEGLPMSVLEAWAYGVPVLMTDHCNLPEGFLADAALRIGTDATSIAEGMRLLLRSPTSDLRSLGSNGRALVARQFTWPHIAAQMKDVYDWVLGGGPQPCSVGLRASHVSSTA